MLRRGGGSFVGADAGDVGFVVDMVGFFGEEMAIALDKSEGGDLWAREESTYRGIFAVWVEGKICRQLRRDVGNSFRRA